MSNNKVVELSDKTLLALMTAILLANRGDISYGETVELAIKVLATVEGETHD